MHTCCPEGGGGGVFSIQCGKSCRMWPRTSMEYCRGQFCWHWESRHIQMEDLGVCDHAFREHCGNNQRACLL